MRTMIHFINDLDELLCTRSSLNVLQFLLIFLSILLDTVSMMNASVNMVMLMSGRDSLNSLTTFLSLPSLRIKFSASTVVSPPLSIHLIRSASSIAFRRLLTRVPSVISSGLTLMTDVVGVSLQEVLATLSARTSQNSSITPIT